jgi:hypothetical protein
MSPETIFSLSSTLALCGWVALAAAPLAPRAAQAVAGLGIPAALGVVYAALMAVHFPTAPGGFGTLAGVAALFSDPAILLAGWIHYLAFDLLVGAWITRTAARDGIAHLWVLPCLFLTLMAGPVGWLLFTALRPLARKVPA